MRVVASLALLGLLLAVVVAVPAAVFAQAVVSPSIPSGTFAAAAGAPTPATTPNTATPAAVEVPAVVDASQIVELTQTVSPGAPPVTVFTAPAGATLFLTDVLVTNPNTSAVCGVDVARGGTAVTGGLCVPAQSSLPLTFVTGIAVPAGTALALASGADATGPVVMHVRGILAPQTPPGTGTGTPPTGG